MSHPALFQVTSDSPLPDRIIEDPFVSVNPKFGGFAITLTPLPSTPAYRPLVEGEAMQEGDGVFHRNFETILFTPLPKPDHGSPFRAARPGLLVFRPILVPSPQPITPEEADAAFADWQTRCVPPSASLAWTAALQWLQSRQPAAADALQAAAKTAAESLRAPGSVCEAENDYIRGFTNGARWYAKLESERSGKQIDSLQKENAALREALAECQKDVARHESGKNAAVREAGRRESGALKALRHVTPCNMCNGMAQALLAKAALSGAQPSLTSTPEPPAKEPAAVPAGAEKPQAASGKSACAVCGIFPKQYDSTVCVMCAPKEQPAPPAPEPQPDARGNITRTPPELHQKYLWRTVGAKEWNGPFFNDPYDDDRWPDDNEYIILAGAAWQKGGVAGKEGV